MSRTRAREIALHFIYEMGFHELDIDEAVEERLQEDRYQLSEESELYQGRLTERQTAYIREVVNGTAARQEELDEKIQRHSKGWSLRRITRLSRAVLRLALYEMAYVEDVPIGAAINEAVELAKEYDSDEAGKFVNGILGAISRGRSAEPADKPEPDRELAETGDE